MQLADFLQLTSTSLTAHRLRSVLTALGIAVGIAAVVLLTSIGAGLQRFVVSEFTQFGTNIISVSPGRISTQGVSVGVFGTVRPLTIDDANALARLPHVQMTNPAVSGNAEVAAGGRTRRVMVVGVGASFASAFKLRVPVGSFLPQEDASQARAFAVLGATLRKELFGDANPLGERVEIGGSRYRVIGVLESRGQVLGMDLDDAVYIPAARALELFNREGLMEINVIHDPEADVDAVVESIRRTMIGRHGRDDVTITPQQKMLDVLSSVLGVLTFAVGALGGISLLVGGVGILTIMTISVAERTGEIGLLRALGARRVQILSLFLAEAALLAAVGGLSGLVLGVGLAWLLGLVFPALPVSTPWTYALLAEVIAVAIGIAAGVLPARRAARMDPVEALRAE
ncbi:MAG: ABC transporter permease [Burkholderiales bacterium]|nr:ABC transporter permease [Burkholderiales bacterium]